MKKIKIAIIGCGGMGGSHLRRMRLSGLFDVVGVLDVDPEKKKLCEQQNMKFFESFDDLKAYPGLEAVLIATPNDFHHDYVIQAAEAKLNIICEKPVTMTSAAYREMVDAAEKNKVLFEVHQNRRWDGDFLCVRQLIAKGDMGKINNIESRVLGSHGVPGAWRKVKAQGGGMIFDWGVHLIDQLLYLKKEKVVGVTCRLSFVYGLEVDDGFVIDLDFEDGSHATVVIETNSFQTLPRWMIYGENGTARINDWNCRKSSVVCVKERIDKKNKGIQAGNGFTKTMANRSNSSVRRRRVRRVKTDSEAFYNNFYNALRSNAEPAVKSKEVMRVLKVMEAAFLSDEKKQTIRTNI